MCVIHYVSSSNIKNAITIIFQFFWKNKAHCIKSSQLEYDMGGIKALEFESVVGTIKIKWLKAYICQNQILRGFIYQDPCLKQ